jgi:hypothetical protein
LLIICAIITTISAIAVSSMMTAIDPARVARALGDIKAIEDDIAVYQTINGELPDSLSQAFDGNLLDPWGNPYQYLNRTNMKGNGQARKDRFLVPLNVILKPIPGFEPYLPIVREHHEWFNGKGYPHGLKGENITMHARVFAVADVNDALVSDRPYRKCRWSESCRSFAGTPGRNLIRR